MTVWQRWNKMSLPNQLLVIIGASGALLTALYVLTAIIQLALMHQSESIASDQNERLISQWKRMADSMKDAVGQNLIKINKAAEANQESIEASNSQNRNLVDATIAQSNLALDASIEASRNDQRAWVGTGDQTFTVTEAAPLQSQIFVYNFGRSPAFSIVCRMTGLTKSAREPLQESDIVYRSDLMVIKQGTSCPSQRFPLLAVATPTTPDQDKETAQRVLNGTWTQYFFGEIRYRDEFDREHWTHFCSVFVPKTNSGTPCAIYNDTDDLQGKKTNQK